ncbi:hypothetical protein [Spirosoma utsteinense]|uniref:Uncharacterized protein n=1 Tax=Spirosoma utsteinense TaxID=2585773 RepID=A0ABR6WC70_9BACT|nr:hypothetical protein [Spirosoma utsteinense]MBC3788808.1 hypothetical protein [Spirosoma utsteinense]MBC3794161.1 hypothetical protein [Spirosoma utsteinense]
MDDEELISAAVLYFPRRPLKVVQNKIVEPDYRLMFNDQPVKLLVVEEQDIDIREAYPKQLIVNFTRFKAMHRDTVLLVRIVYPGNATDVYQMCRKYSGSWEILSDQKGKL